jgi:hypothetical protein
MTRSVRSRPQQIRAARRNPPPAPARPSIDPLSMAWAIDSLTRTDLSAGDRALLSRYAACQGGLTHTHHLQLAWLCVRAVGMVEGQSFAEARDATMSAFRASQTAWIAATRRNTVFHETVTRAYVEIVMGAIETDEALGHKFGDSAAFVGHWPGLANHSLLADLYGPGALAALLADERARREYVSPEEWRKTR